MKDPGGSDDVDDVTLWAGRLRAWPTTPPEGGDGDATVRSPRRTVSADDASAPTLAPVEDTLRTPSVERNAGAAAPDAPEVDLDVTVVRAPVPGAEAPAEHADATQAIAEDARRHGTPPPASVPVGDAGAQREANSPAPSRRDAYAPRAEDPVRVARTPLAPPPRVGDAAASVPRRPRGASRLVLLVAVAFAVVAVAVVGVVLLIG